MIEDPFKALRYARGAYPCVNCPSWLAARLLHDPAPDHHQNVQGCGRAACGLSMHSHWQLAPQQAPGAAAGA